MIDHKSSGISRSKPGLFRIVHLQKMPKGSYIRVDGLGPPGCVEDLQSSCEAGGGHLKLQLGGRKSWERDGMEMEGIRPMFQGLITGSNTTSHGSHSK